VIDTVLMLVVAPLAVAPYLIRAAVYTGNPLFPSFNRVFPPHRGTWSPEADNGLNALLHGFGNGHGPLHFVALPWDLTMKTGHFNGFYGVLFLLLAPLALRWRPRRLPALVACGALLYFFCWFFVGRTLQGRFVVTGFALLAPFAGAGFERALGWARRAGRGAAVALAAGVALLVVLMLPPFLPWWNRERDSGREVATALYETPLPVLLGGETKTEYLDRTIPIHGSDQVLARLARPGDRVLSIDNYIDNTHTDVEHGPYFAHLLTQIYDPNAGDARQLALLRRWHLRFVVVNRSVPDARIGGPIAVLSPRFVRAHLRLVHRDPRSLLYEVRGV
jgi:hypothetical protein